MSNKEVPILFADKKDCCGCGACLNACPHHAIEMREDQCGFLYPQIYENLCVGCGLCKRACNYQNKEVKHNPISTYAAIGKDSVLTKASTSGGIFATVAKKYLSEGGYVCGASFDDHWNVRHVIISNIDDLPQLQGSKYVQSDTGLSFQEIRKLLVEGKKVLFSGTPCQVDGLYGYLRKDYENLTTIDIVCHGVPNNRMFHDNLSFLERKYDGRIKSFVFRDKDLGWGCHGKVKFDTPNGIIEKKQWESSTSYIHYFRGGWIYRDNCYHCKYACKHRPADITIGDFWGIEKAHPEYIGGNGWDEESGISLVIANTEKGRSLIEGNDMLELRSSTFEKASDRNGNLRRPTKMPADRKILFDVYQKDGWVGIEKLFKKVGWRRYFTQIKRLLPKWLKRFLKRF